MIKLFHYDYIYYVQINVQLLKMCYKMEKLKEKNQNIKHIKPCG